MIRGLARFNLAAVARTSARALVLCLCATGFATTGFAQDGSEVAANRTPANAQKFITSTPPQIGGAGNYLAFFVKNVASPDACKTVLSGISAVRSGTQWIEKKTIANSPVGYIGLRLFTNSEDTNNVKEVTKGGPADIAGLRKYEYINSVDGQAVTGIADFKLPLSLALAENRSAKVEVGSRGWKVFVDVNPVRSPLGEMIDLPVGPPESIEATIDWSKVADVTTSSDTNASWYWITVRTQNDPQSNSYSMGYTIAASRDRVLAAAQYLQKACDRTTELGF